MGEPLLTYKKGSCYKKLGVRVNSRRPDCKNNEKKNDGGGGGGGLWPRPPLTLFKPLLTKRTKLLCKNVQFLLFLLSFHFYVIIL